MMSAHLKPYTKVRDTGIDWLGPVPEHWDVRRIKDWVGINQSGLSEKTDPNYVFKYVDIGSVETGRLAVPPVNQRFADAPSRARRVVRRGDTLISTVRTYLKAVWHAEGDADDLIASTGFAVLTPGSEAHPKFVSYFCQSHPFVSRVVAESVGVAYPGIAESNLAALKVCVPPLAEQVAVVRFLDHADRRIRRYICAREKLIALLEEQKQVIIRQAVTGQIDVRTGQPYPAYKDCGVPWLDRVPEHWERRRLKSVLRVADRRSVTGGETLLSLRRDHGVVIYADHFARPPQGKSLVGFKLVSAGQLVVNRLQANNGLVFRSGIEGVVSPDYSVFDAKVPLRMQYLSDLLRTSTYRSHFWRVAKGLGTGTAGFLRVYDDALLATPVFLPPEHEQDAILDWLLHRTADIERAKERQQALARLVDKYRTRLIADVVTGKLDVREAAASLPDDSALGTNQRRAHPADSHAAVSGHSIAKEVHA